MERYVMIVAVDHDAAKKKIEKIQALTYSTGSPQVEILTVEQVAGKIDAGYHVYTLTKDEKGHPVSSEVETFQRSGQRYLRTKKNTTEGDNLAALPPIAKL